MKPFRLVVITLIFFVSGACKNKGNIDDPEEFHQSLLTIDTHVDTPLLLMREGFDLSRRNDPKERGGKLDFPRMEEGGLDGVFFAVFVGQGDRTAEGNLKARNKALAIFDSIHHAVDRNTEVARIALRAEDLKKIDKEGKRAIYIGMENGYSIGTDLSLVQKYYDLGARYITLCHSNNNDICESSNDKDDPEMDGLSEFGEKVVEEMNRLGMIIDVSHISDESFYDVIEVSKAPVMASHSCARAVWDNPRNLDDEMLRKLAENGGVVQLCILSHYVKEDPYPGRDSARNVVQQKHGNYYELTPGKREEFLADWFRVDSIFPDRLATVSDLVDHIDHIVDLIGIDYVGIGTDFDGGGELKDCYDVSELADITRELLLRGYTKDDIRKIWSGNFLRVFREVEKISRKQS